MSARTEKRALQACENCRRKKTKCPGEIPRCSTCARLRQNCRYSRKTRDEEPVNHGHTTYLESRLLELEARLSTMLEARQPSSPLQAQTKANSNEAGEEPPEGETPSLQADSCASLLPPRESIAAAIEIYFSFCHRQPVWLFDPEPGLLPDSCPEEIVLPILALASQYAAGGELAVSLQTPEVYADAARTLVMLRVANGQVMLSTLQGLCLLAYANFVAEDTHLAHFHVSLAKTLIQCSGLDVEISAERTTALEDRRRLFWSIFALDQLFGMPARMPSVLDNVHQPRYAELPKDLRDSPIPCPAFPHESYHEYEEESIGMWTYMVQLLSVWSATRTYVWDCANGYNSSPWAPDSQYTLVCARLLDLESVLPSFIRRDNTRFRERPGEEVRSKRQHWLPWICIQLLYHTIHALLNHPFLYSQHASQHRKGPNMFWRTSAEAAVLHSTGITNVLDMAQEKGLVLSDPLLAHSAAIAATLHFYFSRTSDPRISAGASTNLHKCRSFIQQMAQRWPICRAIGDLLDQLLKLADSTTQQPQQQRHRQPEAAGRSASVAMNTALMWKILDFATPRARSPSGQELFHPSLMGLSRPVGRQDHTTVNAPPLSPETAEPNRSPPPQTATSPEWYISALSAGATSLASTTTSTTSTTATATTTSAAAPAPPSRSQQGAQPRESVITVGHGQAESENQQIQCPHDALNWSWGGGDLNNETFMDATFDSLAQFYDRGQGGSSTMSWYDYGNV